VILFTLRSGPQRTQGAFASAALHTNPTAQLGQRLGGIVMNTTSIVPVTTFGIEWGGR